MMTFEGNGESGADAIIATLDDGEGELALDDAFLYAAQLFGLEIKLSCNNESVRKVYQCIFNTVKLFLATLVAEISQNLLNRCHGIFFYSHSWSQEGESCPLPLDI